MSPDRRAIAFIREDGTQRMLAAQSVGTQAHPIQEWALPEGYWSVTDWLSDLAIITSPSPLSGRVYLTSDSGSELRLLEPTFPMTTEEGLVYAAEYGPRYTPALDRVIVTYYHEDAPIMTVELWDNLQLRQLWSADSCHPILGPSWAPDHSRFAIAAASPPSGGCDTTAAYEGSILHVVDHDGNELLLADQVYGQLSWSPDGSRIALLDLSQRASGVAVVDLTSAQVSRYVFDPSFALPAYVFPIWSPSGRYLALNQFTDEELQQSRVILLDPREGLGYVFEEGAYAFAWLSLD